MIKQDTLSFFDDETVARIESLYTKKITVPVYAPHFEKPMLSELYNQGKFDDLARAINAANIPADVRQFLMWAASRHIVFNFAKIADYYAHSDAVVQDLMEQSALVIVDFNKAIENGFAVLNDDLANQYLEDENAK